MLPSIFRKPSGVLRNLMISLVVGTILNIVNYWDVLHSGLFALPLPKVAINYIVPFIVATVAGLKKSA